MLEVAFSRNQMTRFFLLLILHKLLKPMNTTSVRRLWCPVLIYMIYILMYLGKLYFKEKIIIYRMKLRGFKLHGHVHVLLFNFAYQVILHSFFCCLLIFLPRKSLFSRKIKKTLIELSSSDPDQIILSGLIWVQTSCRCFQ